MLAAATVLFATGAAGGQLPKLLLRPLLLQLLHRPLLLLLRLPLLQLVLSLSPLLLLLVLLLCRPMPVLLLRQLHLLWLCRLRGRDDFGAFASQQTN